MHVTPQPIPRPRARHAALLPYESPAAVVAALNMSSTLSHAERGAVLLAVVSEHRRKAHPLWQSILLVSFEPMLASLRGRLHPKIDEDLDQFVVVGFLLAVKALSAGVESVFATYALRRGTMDSVFSMLRRTGHHADTDSFDPELHGFDVFVREPSIDTPSAEVSRMLDAGGDDAEMLHLVLETCTGGETLKEYVARTHPALGAKERAATYERLCRARRSVLDKLRTRLAA